MPTQCYNAVRVTIISSGTPKKERDIILLSTLLESTRPTIASGNIVETKKKKTRGRETILLLLLLLQNV